MNFHNYYQNKMDDPIAQFIQWYKGRPLVTKTFITLSFLLAICLTFTSWGISDVYYTYEITAETLQLWRPLTALLYLGNLSLPFLIQVYLAYQILLYTEKDFGHENLADFLMLCLFDYLLILLISSFYMNYFLAPGFLFALIYVESQNKPFQQIGIVFGIRVPVKYYIWVYAGFNVLMGQPFIQYLFGLIVGYLYIKIKTVLVRKTKIDFWPTPNILKRLAKSYQNWASQGCDSEFNEDQEGDE